MKDEAAHLGVLGEWLDLASGDAIAVDRDAIDTEAHANLWVFSPDERKMPLITAQALASFVMQMVQRRREQLALDHAGHAMVFYCWHDAQARQLRFSLVSQSHGRLPFRCAIEETGDARAVVDQVLCQDWQWMPLADDAEAVGASRADETNRRLRVFSVRLP